MFRVFRASTEEPRAHKDPVSGRLMGLQWRRRAQRSGGDFDGDGTPEIGGPNAYAWGQPLGGIARSWRCSTQVVAWRSPRAPPALDGRAHLQAAPSRAYPQLLLLVVGVPAKEF
jgi:hypothetical protein